MAVRSVASTLALVMVLAVVANAQQMPGAGQAPPSADVTIHIIDYARIRPNLLAQARKLMARVYGAIGVNVRWADTIDATRAVAAAAPIIDSRDVVVIILSPGMTQHVTTPRNIVGIAATEPEVTGGGIAYVLLDRVRSVAMASDRDVMDVMGLVMAHEVGHLLMPYGAHSATGLMRADWNIDDLRADQGQFKFTRTQAEVIRQSLRVRDTVYSRLPAKLAVARD